MSQIYTKDKNLRITFRCDQKLGDWVVAQSELLGITPSAFVRQGLFSMMASQARLATIMEKSFISSAKAVTHDNNKRNQQYFV